MRKKPTCNIDLDTLIEETKNNIDNDRAAAHSLLTNIMTEILKNPAKSHEELGPVAAKYLEGLQRSSEQLLKLVSALSGKISAVGGGTEIGSDAKSEIFDTLQEEYTEELTKKKEEGKK
jgi:hypothetical protein